MKMNDDKDEEACSHLEEMEATIVKVLEQEEELEEVGEEIQIVDSKSKSNETTVDFNEFFKDLATFEQKYIVTSIDHRR